jgi:hypothetical protein
VPRTPFGPFDLTAPLPHYGADAWAALTDRADVDDELPARVVVRRATGPEAAPLLEEGAVRARTPTHPAIWRMVRRGHASLAGSASGSAFLAYEAPIAARLVDSADALPPAEALALAREVADAVRVLAPESALAGTIAIDDVLVREDGTALVLSAGVRPATIAGGAPLWSLAPENRRTMYMGPPRPHVYFVGLAAYVALAGRSPFVDDAALNAHALTALRDAAPDAPPLLDDVVMRALAERPDDRHESLDELVRDLARCAEELPAPTAHERMMAARQRLAHHFEACAKAFEP